MINGYKRLVLTPKNYKDESLMGFLLRTAEMNVYQSPFALLGLSGLSESQTRNIRPSIEIVASLYGRPPEEFLEIDNNIPGNSSRSKGWKLIGKEVPSIYINAKRPRICPECIQEKGYINQFWYLLHSIGCPHHARIAIDSCPNCGKKLSWCRPGLLTCACGHDLANERGENIEDPAILTMLRLLDAMMRGNISSNPDLNKHGFPLQDLESMSLSTLIGIIYRLQPKKPTRRSKHKETTHTENNNSQLALTEGLKIAYSMLSRWPHGLYDHLENLPAHKVNIESYSVLRQFQSFYLSFFKSRLPDSEIAFLHKGFVSFGDERWKGNAFVDIRLAQRAKTERRSGGIAWLSKYLGIMPPTAIKLVRMGLITGKELRAGKRMRRIFSQDEIPFLPSSGKYYVQREAAKFLGIPFLLLKQLKNDGTYKTVRIGDGLEGFDEQDLIEFRDNIVGKASLVHQYNTATQITIGELIRKKYGRETQARLIVEIKHCRLKPYGRLGNQIRDIIIKLDDVIAMNPNKGKQLRFSN
jgi:hypothetical protein